MTGKPTPRWRVDDVLGQAWASRRERGWSARYQIAHTPEEALSACEDVRLWLEELACNATLDHEAQHCVAEALRDVGCARTFLSALIHRSRSRRG